MNKTIYHGGEKIVRKPIFGTGRQYNDFGLGFYCTESARYAAEWAARSGSNGFVSAYSIDTDGLRVINLCSTQYDPLHWLGLLFNYREFDLSSDSAYRAREYISKYFFVDHQACDCIIGYRADNSCFMFAQDFLDAKLSYKSFRSALTADDHNRQFVLKSNRAQKKNASKLWVYARFEGQDFINAYSAALCDWFRAQGFEACAPMAM